MKTLDQLTTTIRQEVAKDPELQRLINLNWNQRLIPVRVELAEGEAWIDPFGGFKRYLKVLVDPYIGVSLVDTLDTEDCFYVKHLPLTLDKVSRDCYLYEQWDIFEGIAEFKEDLQRLELCTVYEDFPSGRLGNSVTCSFTG